MYQRALQGRRHGPRAHTTLKMINLLGNLYYFQGKLEDVPARATGVREGMGFKSHVKQDTINNLGLLYAD
jgi:hypothetical protein